MVFLVIFVRSIFVVFIFFFDVFVDITGNLFAENLGSNSSLVDFKVVDYEMSSISINKFTDNEFLPIAVLDEIDRLSFWSLEIQKVILVGIR